MRVYFVRVATLTVVAAALAACGLVTDTNKDYTFDLPADASLDAKTSADATADSGPKPPVMDACVAPNDPPQGVSAACWQCVACQCPSVTCRNTTCTDFFKCAAQRILTRIPDCQGTAAAVMCVQNACKTCAKSG